MDIRAGRWRLRLRPDGPGLDAAFALRAAQFRGGAADRDRYDPAALHLTVESGGRLAACARLTVQDEAAMRRGYAAQFYDLAPVAARFGRAVEVGRVAFADPDPELPRLLLGLLARIVADEGCALLYGCASFPGVAPGALARLRDRVAPWGPGRRAAEALRLPETAGDGPLPQLLRLYLAFGAQVSDHAVIDRDLGTTHVLAMLPVADIPEARARRLRGMLAAA